MNEKGETAETDVFAGGDAVHGPASVIQGIADGRAFAMEFARMHGIAVPQETAVSKEGIGAGNLVKKAIRTRAAAIPTLPKEARGGFELVHDCLSDDAAKAEAGRCLECDKLCNICVTVCPNRANQAYEVGHMVISVPTFEVKGIPKANIKIPSAKLAMTRMGKTFASPLGVAAGPHTQLAQNIIVTPTATKSMRTF